MVLAPALRGSVLAAGRLSHVLKIRKASSLFNNPLPVSMKAQMALPRRADAVHGTDPRRLANPACKRGPRNHHWLGGLFLISGLALPTCTASAMENSE